MKKKGKKSRSAATVAHKPDATQALAATEPVEKSWTLLFYICADNDILDRFAVDSLAEICRVGSSPQLHIIVQCDRRNGARRYVVPEGPCDNPDFDPDFDNIRVNTGDPLEAINFLRWGIEHAPSDRVAVILSGLGIHPEYVSRLLIPQEKRPGRSADVDNTQQERLFSICHDQTDHDALEAHELSEILDPIVKQLGRPVDLLALDMGVAAFAEIGYQLQGMAQLLVASQRPLPDAGWPYQAILERFSERLATSEVQPQELAKILVDGVADRFPEEVDDVRMAAIDLDRLETVARVLDTVSLAIMQNLGDWHVHNAVGRARDNTAWISSTVPLNPVVSSPGESQQADFLPAVDLLEFLTNMTEALQEEEPLTPEAFRQRQTIRQLANLLENALKVMKPKKRGESRLFLSSRPKEDRGLSILLLPSRPDSKMKSESPYKRFRLSNSNYLKLRFSSRVHWSAMMGVYQMITEKPHVLWRLISSVLADASGPARDALLQQLVSGDSVIGDLQEQFKSLSSDAALTLSLEPKQSFGEFGTGREYVLRLESPVTSATVAEQVSRVYQSTIDAALVGLELLLKDPAGATNIAGQLVSLGRTLGEDLIQDLASRLAEERSSLMSSTNVTPHLRLQIPIDLMRYPWELMHDGQGLLCDRFAVGRQVFMASDFARRQVAREPGTIRVLVIGDPWFDDDFSERFAKERGVRPPEQLTGAQVEAMDVVAAFEDLKKELAEMPSIRITPIIGERLSRFKMREFLRGGEYDIIHFAGHAQFDKEDPDGSAWLLSDGLLHARDIRNTLAWTESPPWLIFANACEAGMDATSSIGRYQGDVYGLATSCINQGVAAYIAPLWPVDDRVAKDLAVAFYRSLLANRLSLGESLFNAKDEARKVLGTSAGKPGGSAKKNVGVPRVVLSWASFVLYGDPTRRLLESLWSPHASK